ncbi:MAG: hypothetical protein EGR33_01420 [Prevotella sp.]|nr:hypothetical protein [Prevotella sp.]
MLAPQQTIMRANANLRCEGAVAKLDFLCILSTLLYETKGHRRGRHIKKAPALLRRMTDAMHF